MTSPYLPAFAKLLVKLTLAVSITVAAAAFLVGADRTSAAVWPMTTGSIVVKVAPFYPDKLGPTAFNDAG